MAEGDQQASWKQRLEMSRAWLERSKRVVPGCAQTFSKSPSSFVQGVTPNFVAKAKGAYVWDVDGNRYVDYMLGLGPVILGHADPVVNEAAKAQMDEGISFSLPHPIEVEVSEILCELIPCAQMVRFGKNGSDVTAAAVRVARAFTNREKVIRCGYHGWQDWYIGSTEKHRGVPEAVRRLTLSFPAGDLDALLALFRENKDEIACVIMEPMFLDPPAPGYPEAVRDLCHQNGALLVFDEIITGFRFDLRGAQHLLGVTPDLACFGKAMANGFPLSALVGRADVMRLFEEVFFSFTYGGEAVSLAACKATIHELQRRKVLEHIGRRGTGFKEDMNQLIGRIGLAEVVTCVGFPPWTGMRFLVKDARQGLILRSLFVQEAVKRGVLTMGSFVLSYAHDEEVLRSTLTQCEEVLGIIADALKKGDWEARLEGPPIRPVFRQA